MISKLDHYGKSFLQFEDMLNLPSIQSSRLVWVVIQSSVML